MSRLLDAGNLAVVQDDTNVQMFHMLTMHFSTIRRMTDHSHDLSYDFGTGSESFTSTASLLGLNPIGESQALSNPNIKLGISGADSAEIASMMTEDNLNTRFILRRGFFDATGETADANIVGKPFIIYDGYISGWSFTEDPQGQTSIISYDITSHWSDWEKVNSRKSNPENHQSNNDGEFSTDTCFSFVYDQIGNRTWGKVRKGI